MKLKKYFLLTTEFPPFYGGGIATYCQHTVKMLTERGHEVTVILPDKNLEKESEIEEREANLRVLKFKPGGEYYRYLGWFFGLSYHFSEVVKRLIEEEGLPDIIEAQDYLGIAYYLLQRKYALERPFRELKVLITLHTPKFICDLYNEAPSYKFPEYTVGEAEKWCIKAADGVISPSEYLRRELKRFSEFKEVEIAVIRNPYKMAQLWNFPKEGKEVVFVGRLERRKGILELIEYMKTLWKEGWEIPLYLIGGDTWFYPKGMWMSQWLKKKYEPYFKEGFIIYVGKLPPKDLKERLRKNAKVGITPSLIEAFGYVILEFIETGVIPLVSNSGGMIEIIEKRGFIFNHGDESSFKEALKKIITMEEEALEELRDHYFEQAQRLCSYERVYEEKMSYLEKISQSGKRSIYPFLREIKLEKRESKDISEKTDEKEEVKDLLSIVIPYYNLGELLLETLKSVEESSYPLKEIIIVNDASSDPKSLEILRMLEESNKDLKIIHKPKNEGLALARNTGAMEARGEFLAFLDADDLVEREYFEWAIKILKEYSNISFVGCWLEYFEGSKGIWLTLNPEFPYILFHDSLNSQGLIIRRRDFLKYGLNDPKMKYGMEDYDMVINLLKNGKRGVVIPKTLFKYRVRKESMLRQFTPYTYLYLYNLLVEKHKDLYQLFGPELFNLQNANGPAFMIDNPTWESFLWYRVIEKKEREERIEDISVNIPYEYKEALKTLWNKKWFRLSAKLAFKVFKKFLK